MYNIYGISASFRTTASAIHFTVCVYSVHRVRDRIVVITLSDSEVTRRYIESAEDAYRAERLCTVVLMTSVTDLRV